MTVVVGYGDGTHCWLVADQQATFGYEIAPAGMPKVWEAAPGIAVGVAGRPSFAQRLRYTIDVWKDAPPTTADALPWLISSLVPRLITLSDGDCEDKDRTGGSLLVGMHGTIYYIDGLGAVYPQHERGWAAIGTGAEIAAGACYALLAWRNDDWSPLGMLRTAARAAIDCTAACGGGLDEVLV